MRFEKTAPAISGAFLAAGLQLVSTSSAAQEVIAAGSHDAGVGNGIRVTAGTDVQYLYNDNFYFQSSDNKTSASGVLVKPNITLLSDRTKTKYNLTGGVEYGSFTAPGDADDYLDSHVGGGFEWQADSRNEFKLNLMHTQSHDPFGTTRTEATPATLTRELDKWKSNSLTPSYRYGADGALLNLELSGTYNSKRYTTNRDQTTYIDFDSMGGQAALFVNVSPRTAIGFDLSSTNIDYVDKSAAGADERSGTLQTARLALRWKASAKTTGDVRVGYLQRSFDAAGAQDVTGVSWQLTTTWTPVAVTNIKLRAGREIQPTYRQDSRALDTDYYDVVWTQAWTSRLISETLFNYTQTGFVGDSRQDDSYTGVINLVWTVNRLTSLLAGAALTQRESNDVSLPLDYDATTVYAGVRLTL